MTIAVALVAIVIATRGAQYKRTKSYARALVPYYLPSLILSYLARFAAEYLEVIAVRR